VVKFTEHLAKIRNGLERANSAFNEATASFQARVRPAGERLAELGGGATGKELHDLQALNGPPLLSETTAEQEKPVKEEEPD
jgi:DNA recombination protein RmuC